MSTDNLHSTTEQKNENSKNIDKMSTIEICQVINNEDQTVPVAVNKAVKQISKVIDLIFERFENKGRLIYVGAGTSGRIGILDASEMVPTFSVDPSKVMGIIAGRNQAFMTPIEGAEDNKQAAILDLKNLNLTNQDIVFGIAASGVTPYVLAALEYGKSVNALTIGLCMSEYELMHLYSDEVIKIITGPEIFNGSTRLKAGTATKLVLNMISTTLMIKLGRVYKNYMLDLKATNSKLRKRALHMVKEITNASESEVLKALELANYNCRIAVVMIMKNLDFAKSKLILKQHKDDLHAII